MRTSQKRNSIYLLFQRVIALVEILMVSVIAKELGTTEAAITAVLLLSLHRQEVLMNMCKSVRSWQSKLSIVAVFTAAIWILILLFTPLLSYLGLPYPDYSSFAEIQGNTNLLVLMLLRVWTAVAFGEEVLGRVFLIDRFESIFKGLPGATPLAVILAAVLFGLAHAYQGIGGAIQAGTIGLILGILYLYQKRSIWTNVVVHGTVDTIAMLLLFFGVKFM
jgi:membrane protease YdiL (CAAX protease family)